MPASTPFLPEDGATFCGLITPLSDGRFRATCFARLRAGAQTDQEIPQMQIHLTKITARLWVKRIARARGFRKLSWKDAYSAED
jgi:hypothetical protein